MEPIQVKMPDDQQHACLLGSKMAAKGFELKDNPYVSKATKDLSIAWQKGYSWFGAMENYSERLKSASTIVVSSKLVDVLV